MTEDENEVTVRAELPGFEPDEIDVQVYENLLTIKAEKEEKHDGREEYRSYRRSLTLPSGVETNNVQATYHNGVLELHVARSEQAKPKKIKVQGDEHQSRTIAANEMGNLLATCRNGLLAQILRKENRFPEGRRATVFRHAVARPPVIL